MRSSKWTLEEQSAVGWGRVLVWGLSGLLVSHLGSVPSAGQQTAAEPAVEASADGVAASGGESAEEPSAAGWIPGGETSEGFTLAPVPIPDLSELEPTVAKQLQGMADNMTQWITEGQATRNELGEAFGETGQVFHAYELAETAKPCYENAMLMLPGDPRWPHLLGYLHQQAGDLEAARAHYAKVLESGSGFTATLLRLVEIHLQEGELDRAAATLEEVLEEQPNHLAARALMAEVALAKGEFDNAIAGFEAVLAEAPEANRYHYSLALAYRDNRNMNKAREHMALRGEVGLSLGDRLVEGLEDRKRGERVFLLRGRRAFAAGRFDEAAEAFAQAVAAEPTSGRSRVNLGSSLAAAGKVTEAIEQYRIVLQLDPENATAHYNLGHLLSSSDDPEAALEHLQFAAEADAKDVQVRLLLGQLLRRLGRGEQALGVYAQLMDIDAASEEIRLRHAATLVDLGRFGEGRDALEAAVAAMPQEGRLIRALARLLAGSPELAVRDGERALELARTIWQVSPTASHAELMAQAYGELQKCDEASAWQQVALDMSTGGAAGGPMSEAQVESFRQKLSYYKEARPCRPPV